MHIGGHIDALKIMSKGAWVLLAYLSKYGGLSRSEAEYYRDNPTPPDQRTIDCDADGWGWVADYEIEERLNLTPNERKHFWRELVKLGVLKTEKRSFSRPYFSFDWKRLNSAIDEAEQGGEVGDD